MTGEGMSITGDTDDVTAAMVSHAIGLESGETRLGIQFGQHEKGCEPKWLHSNTFLIAGFPLGALLKAMHQQILKMPDEFKHEFGKGYMS